MPGRRGVCFQSPPIVETLLSREVGLLQWLPDDLKVTAHSVLNEKHKHKEATKAEVMSIV